MSAYWLFPVSLVALYLLWRMLALVFYLFDERRSCLKDRGPVS